VGGEILPLEETNGNVSDDSYEEAKTPCHKSLKSGIEEERGVRDATDRRRHRRYQHDLEPAFHLSFILRTAVGAAPQITRSRAEPPITDTTQDRHVVSGYPRVRVR